MVHEEICMYTKYNYIGELEGLDISRYLAITCAQMYSSIGYRQHR